MVAQIFRKTLGYIGMLLVLVAMTTPAQASTLKIVTKNSDLRIGDEFSAEILLHTQKPINVVSATLKYRPDTLSVQTIDTSKSIISLWTHIPADSQTGIITFSGGLPTPGFIGENGIIATVVFKVLAVGDLNLDIENSAKVLLNDGKGTEDPVLLEPLIIHTTRLNSEDKPKSVLSSPDTTPPTDIQIDVGKDPALFENKFFAAFQGKDTGSGIAKYEIAEAKISILGRSTYPEEWREVKSPAVLEHQTGHVQVFIRAIDHAGNISIESKKVLLSDHRSVIRKVEKLGIFFILLVIILVILLKNAHKRYERTVQK